MQTGHYLCKDFEECKASKPLCGLTPKQYWELREASRQDREKLTYLQWFLEQDLADKDRAEAEADEDKLMAQLEGRIQHAHILQVADEDRKRLATIVGGLP
jgi:hypothetical protein